MRRSNQSSKQVVAQFQALESRTMMCVDHLHPSPTNVQQTPANYNPVTSHAGAMAVPVLNSKLGAKATLYLDFDGDVAQTWGSYNVSSTPGYGGTSAQMTEIWARVAEKFSSFDINVTTVNPGTLVDKKHLRVMVGGAGAWTGVACGGLSYVGSFVNGAPNTAYVFPDNLGGGYPKYVAEAICHESGHAFGLQHQSAYSGGSVKVSEYSDNGGNTGNAPTMGNSYGSSRGTWWRGLNSNGTLQDDMAVIASSTNGFGYRVDDYGSSFATAKGVKFSGNKFSMKGTIEKTSDSDQFVFTVTTAGVITLKTRGPAQGATLDSSLRLYRPDGSAVAKVDTTYLGETLIKGIQPGKYIVIVSSKGYAGDVGQYTLTANWSPTVAASKPAKPAATTRAIKFSDKQIAAKLDDLKSA